MIFTIFALKVNFSKFALDQSCKVSRHKTYIPVSFWGDSLDPPGILALIDLSWKSESRESVHDNFFLAWLKPEKIAFFARGGILAFEIVKKPREKNTHH